MAVKFGASEERARGGKKFAERGLRGLNAIGRWVAGAGRRAKAGRAGRRDLWDREGPGRAFPVAG
jgi:hypothetical protein